MMNGLFKDTFAELFDKKTVYIFFIITIISMIFTIYSSGVSLTINGSGQNVGLEEMGFNLVTSFLHASKALMSFLIFLAVMLSSGLIPNMFIKGRADYFLSKPLSRKALLLKKFLSIWLVYGLLVVTCGTLFYVTGALVYSAYSSTIFILLGFAMLEMFVWLSMSLLFGIITGKSVSTIMFMFVVWIAQYFLSYAHSSQMIFEQFNLKTVGKIADYLYYALPKITELSSLVDGLISQATSLNSYVFYSTVGFSLIMVYFALTLFSRKNY